MANSLDFVCAPLQAARKTTPSIATTHRPDHGQKINVKLREGEWQEATCQDDNFIDLYGLPLGFAKILEWRPRVVDTPAHAAGLR